MSEEPLKPLRQYRVFRVSRWCYRPQHNEHVEGEPDMWEDYIELDDKGRDVRVTCETEVDADAYLHTQKKHDKRLDNRVYHSQLSA